MRRAPGAAAVAAALGGSALLGVVLAGCGGEAGDLIAIEGSGGARPAHTVVVTGDGRGSCDGSALAAIESDRLIDAREVEREIKDLANDSREFGELRGRRRYVARTNDGVVRWSEGARGLPDVLPKASLLALQLERALCR